MTLRIEALSKEYAGGEGSVVALRDVSLEVGAGEFVAVMGPSGCGKTTLLLTVGGLQSPDSGRVEVAGEDVFAMTTARRAAFRARSIGFVFQQFHLVPYLTVLENVLVPSLAVEVPDARSRANELLERFGLGGRARHVPAKLSTGERQRTALARALLASPALLLADEPTGNLDRENADIVLRHVAEFAADGGAVLLVTHDPTSAAQAGRIVEMRAGSVCAAAEAG